MDHRTKCEEMRKKTCDSPKHWGPKCNCMKPNEERVRPAPKAAKSSPKSPTAPLARAGRGPFLRRNIRSALKRSSKRRKMLVKVENNENVDWSDSDSEESESDSDESNISNLIDDEQLLEFWLEFLEFRRCKQTETRHIIVLRFF